MKKSFILLFMFLSVFAFVFADVEPSVVYDKIDFAYQPTMARYDAMGQTGLALPTRLDSYYTNPATLGAKRGFALNVPTLSFTFYNLQKLVSDPVAMDEFNNIIKGDATDSETKDFAATILNNLGSGHNVAFKLDAGIGVKIGILGLSTNMQIKMHSLNTGSSMSTQNLIPEVNLAQTAAVGLRFINTDALSLSAGVSVHGVYKAYYKGIDAPKILEIVTSDDPATTLLWGSPVMGGWAVPFDVGVTLGLFRDQFTIAATANNLNGTYHMKSYSGAGYLINSFSEGAVSVPEDAPEKKDSVDFTVETPWSLNFGFAFAPDIDVIQPVITADLIDMFELIKSFNSETFRASDLLLHLNLGAELGLFQIVKARIGINRGYMSLGAAIWLPFMEIDCSYGWQELGLELGDKPVDSFTVKFSIGYDK